MGKSATMIRNKQVVVGKGGMKLMNGEILIAKLILVRNVILNVNNKTSLLPVMAEVYLNTFQSFFRLYIGYA